MCNDYPYLGASADGLVYCKTCGNGLIEIKCPYNCMEKLDIDYVNEPNSIHIQNVNNEVTLKKTSKWYCQI